MGQPSVGSVVVISFPFSNLKGTKLRPALVVGKAEFENVILCQITSRPYSSSTAILLEETDFSEGKLSLTSYIRPDKIFTAEPSIIKNIAGRLNPTMTKTVLKRVGRLFLPYNHP